MKNLILLITILVMGMTLTACGIPGVTEPFDNANNGNGINAGQENKDTGNNVEPESIASSDEKKYIPEDMPMYNIGDKVEYVERNTKNEDFRLLMTFTVNSATVYEHALDSGISENEFIDTEIYERLSPLEPNSKPVAEYINSRLLLCDISIDYEDLYLEENEPEDNITFLELIYVYDDKSYVRVGYPCYLSNSLGEGKEWYYNVSVGETVNFQVGWVVDAEVFKLDEFDLSRLYLARTGDADFMRVIYLGLAN